VAADDVGDRPHVVDDAGRGLAQRGEHDLDAVVLGEQPAEVGGVEAHTPARLVLDHVGAVGLGELDPPLAELARGGGENLRARPYQVGDGGLHRARPAGRERQHRVGGLEHLREPGQHARVELVERGSAVVEHRRRHRLRHRRWHRRRPSGHEVLLDERVRGHVDLVRRPGSDEEVSERGRP
jgi:hypothetical protein